jgi:ribosomal protein L29
MQRPIGQFTYDLVKSSPGFHLSFKKMADNSEHLVLEQFRALRNQISAMQTEMHSEFSDVKHRISRVETAIAGIRRDEAGTAEDIARQQISIDQLNERIVRIERRLELRDG